MEFDRKNSRIVWILRQLPGKCCVDLETRLTWQSPKSLPLLLTTASSSFHSTKPERDRNERVPSSIPHSPSRPLPPAGTSTNSSSSSSGSQMISSSLSCSSSSPLSSSIVAASHRLDVGPAFLEFELSGFSQSGFRIEALKFVDSASSQTSSAVIKSQTLNVNRWLRCITLDGNTYSIAPGS